MTDRTICLTDADGNKTKRRGNYKTGPVSEETKEKMRKASTGRRHTEATKQKLRELRLGKKHQEEHKRKISLAATGDKNGNWKGGRVKNNGYILVFSPDHPFRNHYNYVFEHRLVMEEHLGRHLERGEVVHHINKVKTDNRIENLRLCASHREHALTHCENSCGMRLSQNEREQAGRGRLSQLIRKVYTPISHDVADIERCYREKGRVLHQGFPCRATRNRCGSYSLRKVKAPCGDIGKVWDMGAYQYRVVDVRIATVDGEVSWVTDLEVVDES